ncbi:MAG TPA: HDOD domain-containing protein [Desulfosalsimonadaceae bacterium]|nr:HDOD domain-containing protein [Desulfosalsimonadaceae bacterium]
MTYRKQIAQHIDRFPEMPPLCRNLLGYLNDPEVDFQTIKGLVQYDPGLTANVLRMANSVYFGPAREVGSLQAALVRLGTRRIFELVLSLSVSDRLVTELPGYGLQARELLRHCIWTAVAAQELAVLLEMRDVDTVFTVGLLHDLGLILLDPFLHEEQKRFNRVLEEQSTSFEQAEKAILGMDHAEAGARVLANWQLGPQIVEGVRWHHEPEQAEAHQELVYLIHLADMLSLSEGIGTGIYGLQYNVSPATIRAVGLKKTHIEVTASKTLDRMRELEEILG